MTDQIAWYLRPCPEYEQQADEWRESEALLGGSKAMREAKLLTLPPFPLEDAPIPDQPLTLYDIRVRDAELEEFFGDAVRECMSDYFAQRIEMSHELPDAIAMLETDVDGDGTTLTQYAKNLIEAGIGYGLAHTYIAQSPNAANATQLDQARGIVRPYLVLLKPTSVIGWRFSHVPGAIPGGGLHHVRWLEDHTVYDDPEGKVEGVSWGNERIRQDVRVIEMNEDGRSFTSRLLNTETGQFIDDPAQIMLDRIPFVTMYTNRIGRMIGTTPLRNLKRLNLRHFRALSDHDQLMHYIRAGSCLFRSGWTKEELEKVRPMTPRIYQTGNTATSEGEREATLQSVEIEGKGLEKSAQDLDGMRDEMRKLQKLPRMEGERQVAVTATSAAINYSTAKSDTEAWKELLEATIVQILNRAAEITGTTLPEDFNVRLVRDDSARVRSSDNARLLWEMRKVNELSPDDHWRLQKSAGLIDADEDVEKLIQRASDSSPPGGAFSFPDPPQVDDSPADPAPQEAVTGADS